jgi:hypothetical protein
MQVTFTIEQLNQVLNMLSEIPYKFSQAPINLIHDIAIPQITPQAASLPPAPAEDE